MNPSNTEKTTQPEKKSAMKVLEETSRTFYIPISYLPDKIREAVASAYLCLRAIDEVEDHPKLENDIKSKILKGMSYTLQTASFECPDDELKFDWYGKESELPEVTLRIIEWIKFCPKEIMHRVIDSTATMADRMAFWAERNWTVNNKQDLDCYTFAVAGAVGLILSELWEWYEGVKTDRGLAISFGRGLQVTNIIRNNHEDKERGVSFYPKGWTDKDMQDYALNNLKLAEDYVATLPEKSAAITFCKIPLALAVGTINVIQSGGEKLGRSDVLSIVKKCLSVGGH